MFKKMGQNQDLLDRHVTDIIHICYECKRIFRKMMIDYTCQSMFSVKCKEVILFHENWEF